MVQFQMHTSNRPETIAFVKNAEDIKSFRENPEWYELKEQQVESVDVTKTTKTSKKINKESK